MCMAAHNSYMRKIVLFIAMSLDGYIADAVVMEWNTYHQIVTELSPGEWVYDGLTS